MLITNKFHVFGHLTIRVVDGRSGKTKQLIETPNLIVNGTKDVLCGLLCHENFDRYQLWGIGAGISGDTAVVSQTDLQGAENKRFKKKYDTGGRTYGESGLIILKMVMGLNEGNILSTDDYYMEAGLFSRGDVDWEYSPPDTITNSKMLARQLHAPVHKNETISLEYTWRIQIAIS